MVLALVMVTVMIPILQSKNKLYEDLDGDGQGLSSNWIFSCENLEGYVEERGDCDDSNAELNSLDLDEDGVTSCNGDCDDSDSDIKKIKLYEDLDGDGSGNTYSYIHSCEDVEGYVDIKGDCDDEDPLLTI